MRIKNFAFAALAALVAALAALTPTSTRAAATPQHTAAGSAATSTTTPVPPPTAANEPANVLLEHGAATLPLPPPPSLPPLPDPSNLLPPQNAASPATSGSPPATWQGGPVQHHPLMFIIFWGPNWNGDQTTENNMKALFQNAPGNGWTNILAQYNDSTDQIHPTVNLTGSWQTPDHPPANIDPSSMENEILNAAAVRGWQLGADSQFMVAPEPGASINYAAFGQTPGAACAWHSLTPTQFQVYDLMPYAGNDGCANGTSIPAAMTRFAGHEYAEAATDPDTRTGWRDSTTDARQQELGDMCNGYASVSGPGGQAVPLIWSGGDNGCVSSYSIIYGYSFVNEHGQGTTFPHMAKGHGYSWWLQISNQSNVPWGVGGPGQVRLGTQVAQDRCSAFADGTWLGCSRITIAKNASTGGTGPIAPGQVAEFDFNFDPSPGLAAGTYREHFSPVAEGYTWMGGDIWWDLTVGERGGGYAGQTNTPQNIAVNGMTYTVSVTMQNTGDVPWFGGDNDVWLGTSHPYARSSAFQAATWPSYFHAAGMTATEVDPGGTYTFQYQISVPPTLSPGNYQEFFDLDCSLSGYFTNTGYNLPLQVV